MSTGNPLIADNDTHQTLHNASCVLSYLQAVKPIEGLECLDDDTEYGLSLLFDTVMDALNHEKERALEQRKAAYKEADA